MSKIIDEFEVNRWMVHLGFVWSYDVKLDPRASSGIWIKDGYIYTQAEASFWYETVKPRKIFGHWL